MCMCPLVQADLSLSQCVCVDVCVLDLVISEVDPHRFLQYFVTMVTW